MSWVRAAIIFCSNKMETGPQPKLGRSCHFHRIQLIHPSIIKSETHKASFSVKVINTESVKVG
jgi:hypothetical protein